jgi:hypothetical protein
VTQPVPADDARAAGWLSSGIRGFAESVLSVVPDGFPAYVRAFHPAHRVEGRKRIPVHWTEIAAATGKVAHAAMQLPTFTESGSEYAVLPGVFDDAPAVGSLPTDVAAALVGVLGRHTTTPAHCWFAVWAGYGALAGDVRRAPTFTLPNREYHLLRGPIGAAGELAPSWRQSPNIWWPDDRAWCVATEIDLNTTYIGCSSTCAGEIVAAPEIEAAAIDPSAGITFDSDFLNAAK